MNTNMRKPLQRLLAIALSFAVLLGRLPMTAFAESDEQFSLALGATYYFDLSAQGVPGTVNAALPDTSLKWVPFTYAGTVNAYSLDASSSGDTSASGNATASDRSLFVADHSISHTVSWNDLNGAGLIFGKNYNAGGVAYTLRSLSVGSSNNGQSGAALRGTPEANEWDQILNKDGAYLKNWSGRFSLGQDTLASYASYRVIRGCDSARDWSYSSSSVVSPNHRFLPVLEILTPDTLGADGLKTVTYDMDGNGTLGSGSLASATVVYTGSLILPEITLADGFNYTGTGTGTLGWYAGAVFHPVGTSLALASGTILKAGREPVLSSEITGDFTDANFLAEVRTALGKGASDPIYDTDDFASVTSLNVSNKTITSLAGIEHFTALTSLDCSFNELIALDVSSNIALTSLDCSFNQITPLDASGNTVLTSLDCSFNQITSLDVSNNTALTSLNCCCNQLTSLAVSDNTVLTSLNCSGNQITSLDVSNNTALTSLDCSGNQIASLDVSNNIALTPLNCSFNQLSSLDVSNNTALTSLNCNGNQITSLDVSNNIVLTSLNCGGNQLTELDVSSNTALTSLDCGNSQLTELDLSKNTALTSLNCYNNPLTTLDLSKNTALTELNCYMNQLGSLDLNKNTVLTALYCFDNQLATLDLSKNTALTELNCYMNQLTELDLSSNTALTRLSCDDNQLTALDLSKNAALDELSCERNQLAVLNVSSNIALTRLYCGSNQLTELDMSSNIALTRLYCGNNQLTELDMSNNTALSELYCGSNQLTELDMSNNAALSELSCSLNQLSSLNVSNNAALTWLSCYDNWLTALDVSNNSNLTSLDCYYNYMPDESAITGLDEDLTTFFSFYPQHSGLPPVNAVRPSINSQPAGATYAQNAPAAALSVTAAITDSGTLSYQWYKNAGNSTTGGMPVGINSSNYTPPTNTVGTTWYYCVVTNTNLGATGNQTAAATSNTAAVTVSSGGGSFDGDYTPPDTIVHNTTSPHAATIWLSGRGLSSGDLLIVKPLTSGGSYKALFTLADEDDVLGVYDISLRSGKTSTGSALHLTFSIGAKYAGRAFTLVHQKEDGSFEYFFATADASGNVKFGPLYSLSPFMLVKGTMLYTPQNEVIGVPQTGDNFSLLPFALLALVALCGAGAMVIRKHRVPRR